jgi:cytoskeletal protein RodZ
MSTPRRAPVLRHREVAATRPRSFAWAVVCVIGGWSTVAIAQTYYKWTDNRGVVHFSDQAPVQQKGVEERQLAPAPPVSGEAESATQPATANAEGSNHEKKTEAAPGEGPAQVVVVSRESPRTGPSAMHIHGEVKNVGGEDAQRVAVTISAVDSQQGNPCLHDEVPVTPSTLHPGETGKFDTHVDSPCLFGDAEVDVGPVWE